MSSSPPVAPARPDKAAPDPYAWMRDAGDPALLAYLAAERAYYDQQTAPAAAVRDELTAEMSARVVPAAESASWRRGNFDYFTRTVAGLEYEQLCRRPARDPAAGERDPAAGELDSAATEQGTAAEVLLDQNLLLQDPECGGGYVELGVREVSPDGALLAYSVDFDGDEVYQLRIRDLAGGADLAERIDGTYYELAWAADSRSFFYTVPDPRYRPHEVWLHRLGTPQDQDVLVFAEPDERFELTVRSTRSGAYVLIESESRDTTETLLIPAADASAAPAVLEPRRAGVEYRADHGDGPDGGQFYLVTNDEATDFRLVRAAAAAPGRAGWA